MRTSDICWLAGLLEGEGWFQVPSGSGIKVGLQSSDRDVIERAAALLGTTVLGPYSSSGQNLKSAALRNEPYKERWSTVACGRVAAGWMMTLYPQLSQRRKEKIRTALLAWQPLQPYNGDKKTCRRGHEYSGGNLRIRANGWRRCVQCVQENNRTLTAKRRNRRANSTGGLQAAVSESAA